LPGASGSSSAPVTTSRRTAASAVPLHYEWGERSWNVLGRVAKEDAIARPMPVLG
jgi:hypothetical protein